MLDVCVIVIIQNGFAVLVSFVMEMKISSQRRGLITQLVQRQGLVANFKLCAADNANVKYWRLFAEVSGAFRVLSSSNSDRACIQPPLLGNGRERGASSLVDGLRQSLEPASMVLIMVLKSGDGVWSERVQQNIMRHVYGHCKTAYTC